MAKQPILPTEKVTPPPALVRADLEKLPAIIRAQGERTSRRFIEFFTASMRNCNWKKARGLVSRGSKGFFQRPLKQTAWVRTSLVSRVISPFTMERILPSVFRLTQALMMSAARCGWPAKSRFRTAAP